MLAALLLVAAPAGPFQDGPAGAARSEDPGLVLHLTGELSRDRAEVERAGLELQGFKQRYGAGGWSMSASPQVVGEPSSWTSEDHGLLPVASLTGIELGPTSSLEFFLRPRGEPLSVVFDDQGLLLHSLPQEPEELQDPHWKEGLRAPVKDTEKGRIVLTVESTAPRQGISAWTRVEDQLPADRWTHVAIVRDEATTGTIRLMVDGVVTVRQLGASPEDARRDAGAAWPTSRLDVRLSGSGVGVDLADLRIHDRFVSTAELRERRLTGLGHTDPSAALSGPRLDSPEAWATGTFERVVPEASGAEWVAAHWSLDRPVPGPHARTCHAVVTAGPGRLLVFGGELRDTHAGRMANGDDAWIYDLDEQRWQRIAGGVTGRTSDELRRTYVSGLEVSPAREGETSDPVRGDVPPRLPDFTPTHGPAPDPRCHQGMSYDPTTNSAFLLGGWFNDGHRGGPRYDDVWLLDLDANTWRRLPQTDPVPAITDVQPVFHAGLGRFVFATRDAVWSLDPADGQLVRERDPLVLGQRLEPLARAETTAQAMTWYDPDQGALLRFGGFWVTPADELGGELGLERTNALMAYSHELGAWVVTDTPEVAPGPRVRGAVAYDTKRDRSVLFGGITGELDDRTNDLWTYDALTKRWTEHRASNAPGPRGGYFGMAYDEERDVFVVPFGRQDTMTFLDEVWRLSFDEEAWGTATWRFDREGWRPGLVAAVEWVGPEGAEEELEPRVSLRGSDDGVAFGAWGPEAGDERFVELRVELAPGMRLTSVAFE